MFLHKIGLILVHNTKEQSRSVTMLRVVGLALLALAASVNAKGHYIYIDINANTTNCGETFDVPMDEEYMVRGSGEAPGVDCSYVFRAQMEGNCNGLCYIMKQDSFFRDENVTFTIVTEFETKDFHTNRINREKPMCSESSSISVSLTTPLGYTLNEDKPGFGFQLEVYNYCQDPFDDTDGGDGNSITFDEAIKHLENFHHAEKFDEMVQKNLVTGLLVGFSLASIFLVILCISCCYVRNNPHRGKKAPAWTPPKTKESGGRPENVQLLTVKSDPEKPPIGGATKG